MFSLSIMVFQKRPFIVCLLHRIKFLKENEFFPLVNTFYLKSPTFLGGMQCTS